jgi:hypothetical protein
MFAEHGSDWYNQHLLEVGDDQDDYADPEINEQQVPN